LFHGVRKKARLLSAWAKARVTKPREELQASDFRSAAVGEAFTRAVRAYRVPRYEGDVVLIRPKLDQVHELEPGRWTNAEGGFVGDANYWETFIPRIQVEVVTGDHNSMVLEPHVRVLASKVRAHLARAQARCGGAVERVEPAPRADRAKPGAEPHRPAGSRHGTRREALATSD
jgi:thioesterase domain-containing protein